MPVFGAGIARLREPIEIVLPTLPALESLMRAEAGKWRLQPRIVPTRDEKYAAMRRARGALVASGTATLELALAGVPMVVAYRVSRIEEVIARLMLSTDKIALPNLILSRHAVPEFVQGDCSPGNLAETLQRLLAGGGARDAQLAAFQELTSLMDIGSGNPSDKAAEIIERLARERLPSGTRAASRAIAGAPRSG
jgi:lipid-A-disaccharide synthase